jgi:hypothetical protein
MSTILIGIKDNKSNLSFTKVKVFPNHLYLLSNPLLANNKKIQVNKSCSDGNLNEILNISVIFSSAVASSSASFSSSTLISKKRRISNPDDKEIKKVKKNIRKYEKNIKEMDLV